MNNSSVANQSIDALVKALGNLDNRPVPTPEIYRPESGQAFTEYLDVFESYCARNFRGGSDLWGSQLGNFLEGDLLQAYRVLRVPGEGYNALKLKLVEWLASSQDKLEHEAKRKFTQACRAPDERIRLYAARLEKLFQVAYPRRSPDCSKSLRDKLIDTVPGRFREQLLTAQSIGATMGSDDLTWTKILVMASQFDARDYSREVPAETCYFANDSRVDNSYGSSTTCSKCLQVCTSEPSQDWARKPVEPKLEIPTGSKRDLNSEPRREPYPGSCFHCGKRGHVKKDCFRLKNACFTCGSESHRMADCPQRRSSRFGQRPNSFANPNSEPVGRRTLNSALPK